MLRLLQGVSLVLATMTTGMMAGVFALYAHTIMPGLANLDDRAFIGAFQSLDRAIINPWFLPTFIGALVFSGLAALLQIRENERSVLLWAAAASVLYLVTFIVTLRVHVPLNDAIKAAGDPDRIADVAAVRARFDEARWIRFNLVRVATTLPAFGCLAWALVRYGRGLAASGL